MANAFKSLRRFLRPQGTPPPRSTKIRRRRKRLRLTGFSLLAATAAALTTWAGANVLHPPQAWAWSIVGTLSVAAVAFIAWWQRHPVRHVWALACIGGAATTLGWYAWTTAPPSPVRIEPNRQTAERVLSLKQALERRGDYRHSSAVTAFFPPPENFIAFVRAQPHGDALLLSPWGGVQQTQLLKPTAATGLPTAAERHQGYPAPPLGSELGPGSLPAGGFFTPTTYGAILYDRDARSGRYVLYGIGRRQNSAILVAMAEGEP